VSVVKSNGNEMCSADRIAPTLSQKARKDGTPNLRHVGTNKSVRVRGTVDRQPFLSNFLIASDEVKKGGLENETGLDL